MCAPLQVFTDVDINLAPSAQLQPDAANGAATPDAAAGSSGPANGTGPEAPAANGSAEPPTAAEPAANGSSDAASDPEDWSNSQMLSLVGAMKKHGKVICSLRCKVLRVPGAAACMCTAARLLCVMWDIRWFLNATLVVPAAQIVDLYARHAGFG
jgi:hypothetical protein